MGVLPNSLLLVLRLQTGGLAQCYRKLATISSSIDAMKIHHQHCIRESHQHRRSFSSKKNHARSDEIFNTLRPEFDWSYLCNKNNLSRISENIKLRKGIGDIHKLHDVWQQLEELQKSNDLTENPILHTEQLHDKQKAISNLTEQLHQLAADIPNHTHPDTPIGEEDQAKLVRHHGEKREFHFKPKTVQELGTALDVLRTVNVGYTTGSRSYYFLGGLAHLEQALVSYALDVACDNGFVLMSIPDLVHPRIIEACGFKTTGERNQVYKLKPSLYGQVCLAGTGEMPLAGFYMNSTLDLEDLPQKVVAVSRCYRAETSELKEERGIYRVHQFTKVEMFVVTANETSRESEIALNELLDIQTQIFSAIDVPFRVLDMPSQELGASAYRKYDMEAWMPAMQMWGEISSTSNCTDFQSRRLNMKYRQLDGNLKHLHTVNGTACAVPRMAMAIMENYQNKDGSVDIPMVLHPYMNGETTIKKAQTPLKVDWLRNVKSNKS